MIKLIRRFLLLTILFVFCSSLNVFAGTMEDLLFNSILNNDKKMFKMAVDNGADVNAYDQYKQTPLGFAVSQNKLEFVNELIAKGADVDKNSYYVMGGNTPPLTLAVYGDNFEMVKVLIGAGADVNGESETYRNTPLIIAVDQISVNPKMVAMLIVCKADANKTNKYGMTPLMVVVNKPGLTTSSNDGFNRFAVAKMLLDYGAADPNVVNNYGRKALDIAIEKNFREVIELLMPITKK